MIETEMIKFKEMDWNFRDNRSDDALVIQKFQDIPKDFIDRNRDMKQHSRENRAGEVMTLASIPEVVVDEWMRQGFNVYKESNKTCLARLKAEGLDDFITTAKSI